MTAGAALAFAVVLAWLLVLAFSKPTRTKVSGLLYRDKKGRLVLIVAPAPKRRGRK